MIQRLANFLKRLSCDHTATASSEYDIFGGGSHWDARGEYRPYFEGVEHVCQNCGKTWCTDITAYRYYIDCDRNLIEKVEREP